MGRDPVNKGEEDKVLAYRLLTKDTIYNRKFQVSGSCKEFICIWFGKDQMIINDE